MRIVTQKEMKELEKVAQTKYHFPEKLIIENVALLGANAIINKLGTDLEYGELIFLIGKGFNGGTGLAIARHLVAMGYSARAFVLFDQLGRPEDAFDVVQENLRVSWHGKYEGDSA